MKHFFCPNKIGRISWLVRFLTFLVVGLATMGWVDYQLQDSVTRESPLVSEIIEWGILIGTLLYLLIFVHLPRVRHIGMPTGYVLVSIVPILNLFVYLLFLFYEKDSWTLIKERYNIS